MPRPHVDFVQSQRLPWDSTVTGRLLGTELLGKVLSVDPADGACSELVVIPPDLELPTPGSVDRDQELFVIEGEIAVDGDDLGPMTYVHLPAGAARSRITSAPGALVLSFWGASRLPRELPRTVVDALALPWLAESDGHFAAGAARRDLHVDPDTGEPTFLLGTLPLRVNSHAQKHPVVEEVFLLSGELIAPHGTLLPGAYFWRPPEIWHGPYGQRSGSLMLVRGRGGPLAKEYADEPSDFEWDPAHAPMLPDDLRDHAEPWDPELAPGFVSSRNLSSTSPNSSGR